MWRIKWNVKRFWDGDLDLDNVDLADITGIRPATIGQIMRDACDYITLEALAKICQALHRNVDEVLLLVKDTDDLEGEERDKAILEAVAKVRADRVEKNAERRAKQKAAEELRIQDAIRKALVEYGLIQMPFENGTDEAAETDNTQPEQESGN